MKKLLAVIWDFDGTIADSSFKNFNVTRKIISSVQSSNIENFTSLKTFENYLNAMKKNKNWRTFYRDEFYLTENQIDSAGVLWTEYQLNDDTKLEAFDGVLDLISSLKNYPQAIVSQNSKQNIFNFLSEQNIEKYFAKVVGYEEVDIKKQKPFPDGFFLALDGLKIDDGGTIVYIGDHEADVEFAVNTSKIIGSKFSGVNILSIAYAHPKETYKWKFKPEFSSNSYDEISKYLKKEFTF